MSPPDEAMAAARAAVAASVAGYSAEERRYLLGVAAQAIAAALTKRTYHPEQLSGRVSQPCGAFTTLRLDGHLRGCVGYVLAIRPLYLTIAETAVSAALNDPRFLPLTKEEAPRTIIEISVLSPLFPITPEQIEVGRHGLLIAVGSSRGLLLPQVAVEHGWDAATFLEQTCAKAGLPSNAHLLQGASLQAFTAEVFDEA